MMVEKRGSEPRYQQVAEALRAGILDGTLAEGTQLPTEASLCASYGISRFTAREALRRLQGEGLIRRRRGSGMT
ncbi:GntR family transcriptional regulator [Polymorphobacter sp.]|uniref:GntR family transcriptional regulator n=1 Tax=Polymorphobacter sp. TaxID=1909290 RepID=UPI003F6F4EB6